MPEIEGFPSQKYGDAVEAYRIYGSLFFGAAMKLEALTDMRRAPPKIIILDMGAMLTIDATGLEALENLDNARQRRGGILLLCGLSHYALLFIANPVLPRVSGKTAFCRISKRRWKRPTPFCNKINPSSEF